MRMNAFMQQFIRGMIIKWSGSIASIPAGFALCNGSNGTPDLRNKFIVGAGDNYNLAETGGSMTHYHLFSGSGHSHSESSYPDGTSYGGEPNYQISEAYVSGVTEEISALPPFYALAYIMKL